MIEQGSYFQIKSSQNILYVLPRIIKWKQNFRPFILENYEEKKNKKNRRDSLLFPLIIPEMFLLESISGKCNCLDTIWKGTLGSTWGLKILKKNKS